MCILYRLGRIAEGAAIAHNNHGPGILCNVSSGGSKRLRIDAVFVWKCGAHTSYRGVPA